MSDRAQVAAPLPARASITRGAPLPFVDALGRFLSLANKLVFLNPRFESHEVGPEVERDIAAFIEHHQLAGLHVRLNEYAPLDDLRRLLVTGRTSLLLRLLFGLPTWLATTLSVGRLFGGDHYNPWTDTVNLYTGHSAVALHELGHALDFRRRRFPGLYGLTRYIPGVALYQEYLASRYAIEFMRARGMHEEELQAWRLLFPAYSTYVFGALVELFPSAGTRAFMLPVIAVGHVLGITAALRREAELELTATQDLPMAPSHPTVAAQWQQEWREAVAEVSPGTRRGRDLWGIFLGMSAGSALCGAGALPGAWAGFALARRGEQAPEALPGPGRSGDGV